ncbi:helicase domain protein [Mycobacterium kansasii]|uniref:Helicase domain protein n=1 Tax=Mycobacterium kansasii TaxID=1768 RepID=A0A1V3W9X0_MYCKA|nr:helicase domain protein [Mycobacterium kansasii]
MLATDAAGEGLNLQAAHLMVNYDLPWNPNRIEQRFGRIHRIGQEEVCRLWNLVASTPRGRRVRPAADQGRRAAKGLWRQGVDVLGEAFTETSLRDLLLEAIRYGDQPEVKAKMHEIIDCQVSDGLTQLLEERSWPPSISQRPTWPSCAQQWTRRALDACSRITSSWRSRRRSPDSAGASRNASRAAMK